MFTSPESFKQIADERRAKMFSYNEEGERIALYPIRPAQELDSGDYPFEEDAKRSFWHSLWQMFKRG